MRVIVYNVKREVKENLHSVVQECINPRRQIAVETNSCTVAPNICGSSLWSLLHVTFLAPRILRWSYIAGKIVKSCNGTDVAKRRTEK